MEMHEKVLRVSEYKSRFNWRLYVEKLIKKLFKWEVPFALPMRFLNNNDDYCWEDWHRDVKKKHPIKYFILETVPLIIRIKLHSISEGWYWFASHTYRKQHLLDFRQPKHNTYWHCYRYGWCDITEKMIFVMFRLLEQFIENELGGIKKAKESLIWLENPETMAPQGQIDTTRTAIQLYEWWTVERLQRFEKINALNYKLQYKEMEKLENDINEKLKMLIDIRRGMWT